jgi:hypothetical protein
MHGKIDECLTDLSGFNCQKVSTTVSDIFNIVKNYYSLGYGLMAIPSEARLFTLGIEPNIWFSIVRVCEVQLDKNQTHRLYKLRNPWKNLNSTWNGKFGVGSKHWNKNLMDALDMIEVDANRTEDEESCFWVDETEFIDLFSDFVVSYNFNNEVSDSQKVRHKTGKFSLVKFRVKTNGFGVFSVSQFDSRRLPGLVKDKKYGYSLVRILICQMDKVTNQWDYICGQHGQTRDTILPMNLSPGNYIAIVQAEWKFSDHYDLAFKWTGDAGFQSLGRERIRDKPEFLKEVLDKKANQRGKFKPIDSECYGEWLRVAFTDVLLWVDIIKNNTDKRIYVQQFFEGSENIVCDQESKPNSGQVTVLLLSEGKESILYRAGDQDCELAEEEPAFT